jgi:hypothetical protein
MLPFSEAPFAEDMTAVITNDGRVLFGKGFITYATLVVLSGAC